MSKLVKSSNVENIAIYSFTQEGTISNVDVENGEHFNQWLKENNKNVSLQYIEIEDGKVHLGYINKDDKDNFEDLLDLIYERFKIEA